MGGHAVARDDPAYAQTARLAWRLGSTLVVATGGGPGAMEAANLGAYLSGHPSRRSTRPWPIWRESRPSDPR